MRRSSLNLAQRAMAVGPAAPARTARTAMTRMLGSGCRRLIWERGSSRVEKEATISSSLLRVLAIADLRPPGLVHDTVDGIPGQAERAQGRKVYQIVIKVRAGPAGTPTTGSGSFLDPTDTLSVPFEHRDILPSFESPKHNLQLAS